MTRHWCLLTTGTVTSVPRDRYFRTTRLNQYWIHQDSWPLTATSVHLIGPCSLSTSSLFNCGLDRCVSRLLLTYHLWHAINCSFASVDSRLWNDLTNDVTSASCSSAFCQKIKVHLILHLIRTLFYRNCVSMSFLRSCA